VPPFERFTIPHKQKLLESLPGAKDKVVLLIGGKSKEFLRRSCHYALFEIAYAILSLLLTGGTFLATLYPVSTFSCSIVAFLYPAFCYTGKRLLEK